MSRRSRHIVMILISLLLLAALVYSGVYLYRYLLTFESLLHIPKSVGFDFFLTVAPAFLVTFVLSIILLSTERERYSDREYTLKPDFLDDVNVVDEQVSNYDLNTLTQVQPQQKEQVPEQTSQEQPEYMKSLVREVGYSSDNTYELSLVLLNIEPNNDFTDFDRFRKRISTRFQDSAFIFDYEREFTLMIILPFYSFDEVKKELVGLFDSLREDLKRRDVLFRAGFTSKFSRYIDADTMLYECESAFEKASEEKQFAILGFEPDIERYQQYYSG